MAKLQPNLDTESARITSLKVLQRLDPYVEEILTTAGHVTVYQFDLDLNQWSRKDVEGSLFVVKRNGQPRFQFIVMNRRSTENLVEDILGDFEYEIQLPYLLYRNANQEVNGIWFYHSQECEAIANLFDRILNAYSKVPPKTKVSAAKSEFEELEAIPTSSVIEGPLEPPTAAMPTVTDVPNAPFVNLLNLTAPIGNSAAAPPTLPATVPLAPMVSTAPPVIASQPSLQPSTTTMGLFDNPDTSSVGSNNAATPVQNLLFKAPPQPLSHFLVPPISSSIPTERTFFPPAAMQRPIGAPLLQPFPPPNPPPSLAPTVNHGGSVITKEAVREALSRLVQNDQFVDMVYQEMKNVHFL